MSRYFKYNTGAGNVAQTSPVNDSGRNIAVNYYEVTLGAQIAGNGTADVYIPKTSGKIYSAILGGPAIANLASVTLNNGSVRLTAGNAGPVALGTVIPLIVVEGSLS
jgi:hypothetical protein